MPLLPSKRTVEAPAKINLFLNLLAQRPDGYHDVRFVMQTLALSDTLTITPTGLGQALTFQCDLPALNSTDNLIVKAYYAFYSAQPKLTPFSLDVKLTKRIPVAAGLGGGSSDAAALLKTLNAFHDNALVTSDLATIAATLGSDVPFFLIGGTAIATGRGEVITPCLPLPPHRVLLLKPMHWGISTAEAYHWVREAHVYIERDFSPWQHEFVTLDSLYTALLWNDFEAVIFSRYPQLKGAKAELQRVFGDRVLLSGSGPTLFALYNENQPEIQEITNVFPPDTWEVHETHFGYPLE